MDNPNHLQIADFAANEFRGPIFSEIDRDGTEEPPRTPFSAKDYDDWMRKQGRRWANEDVWNDEQADLREKKLADLKLREDLPPKLSVKLSDGMSESVNVYKFAAVSDVVLAMAANECFKAFQSTDPLLSDVTSILQLGEELNHSKLFSAALDFLVKEIEDFESSDGWDAIDQGVRDKVITLRNLSRSSLIGRGAKVSEVVFASAGEFVAMLEETIQDQSERLLDAKQRQQELRDCIIGRSGNRIGSEYSSSSWPNIRDAEKKIAKQEARILTLRRFLESQKEIFKRARSQKEENC